MVWLCAPIFLANRMCELCVNIGRTSESGHLIHIKANLVIQWEYYYCYCQFENQKQRLQRWCARIDQNLLMAIHGRWSFFCSSFFFFSFCSMFIACFGYTCYMLHVHLCRVNGVFLFTIFGLYFSKSTTWYICLAGFIISWLEAIFVNIRESAKLKVYLSFHISFYYIMVWVIVCVSISLVFSNRFPLLFFFPSFYNKAIHRQLIEFK